MKEGVKILQKYGTLGWKMKESQKKSSKNEKNIQKGVDKVKTM